ncbi:NPCBM/NEW2 domain-containing protein [Granulicatella balaenopterae]|uniref:NPCBM/NEW2 domain-containing protein n=1 Tax=Granulicatella balaenopterae TaxID=137733 RepID=A0A1H9J058_9LACT|nr:glycoside hydrolase family 98 domain-containing protein [Granulicatella balaenopterae]SEQ80186.1 NPCBM/NEW2 domain-containing protein [Granulicatella balaenopterae]
MIHHKYNKVALVVLLLLGILAGINTAVIDAATLENDGTTTKELYLSDLDWTLATHGDVDKEKVVQKDKPFSTGNNGRDNKISLLMPDGTVKEFEKGLGTIADKPSKIEYDISDYSVKSLSGFVGLDQTATSNLANHGEIEKVVILVDDEIVFTTETNYPNGINTKTAAIPFDVAIPDDAKSISLQSFSGSQTWADEVVFADVKLTITPQMVYLSDLNWVSAIHGDADTNKQVQKNKPFSTGNNGQNNQLSLKMADGTINVFEKGLGTIASQPSSVIYDISTVNASEFHTFVGLDRTASGHLENYATIEKIEVKLDGKVVYSTLDSYPNGIDYHTPAIPIFIEIPKGTQTLELNAYAGRETWGDEVDFADAYIIADKKENSEVISNQKRREISNESPLMMIPLYANGSAYEQGNYEFWGEDTLYGKWESIPEDIKPYVVIELHPDDLPKRDGSAADFYEHFLKLAKNHINPQTQEKEPIPIIITTFTAGNVNYYTATHWLTFDWIEQMYKKYDNLQGLFCTENYWVWTNNVESNAAKYLELSAKYGGYFIWSEQNNGAAIEKALGTHGKTVFKDAVDQYWQNFIFMYKNTPAAEGNDAPTTSYMKGLWLANKAYQWGGLMDTWKWYETGKWKLFEQSTIGKNQGNRQWLTEPEAMLGSEALNIYLNGGCVYNFEHPFYTYGVRNQNTPLFDNVILEFFRDVIANPAPTKEDVLTSTKVFLKGEYSHHGNGDYFVGLNTNKATTPLYTTGRYGVIPAVPTTIDTSKLDDIVLVKNMTDRDIRHKNKRINYFENLYPKQYEGDIFAQQFNHAWYLYNYYYNKNVAQTGKVRLTNREVEVMLPANSYVKLAETENGIAINLNNFTTNKDALWEPATTTNEAINLPQLSKVEAQNWVYDHYICETTFGDKKLTTFTIHDLSQEPTVTIIDGTTDSYENPKINYDYMTGIATITIESNGFLNVNISY